MTATLLRMRRILALAFVSTMLLAPAAHAQDPELVIRPGVTVAGVDVGGQPLSQAAGTIDLGDVTVPLLAVAGRGDGIAPVAACHHVGDLVPNAPSVKLETAPGGHLGVLTGRAARATTWRLLDEFVGARRVAPRGKTSA